ncbi:transmembrane sensor [Stenotrophomonas sp. AN71]|uniref:FecR family protein n=1 Tax=Stenotrophomonas sp. AN71 TaxID=3156253 RepID=UPI003D22BF5C
MNTRNKEPRPTDVHAATSAALWWSRRSDSSAWSDADEAEFQAWLKQAPGNRAAFDAVVATWQRAAEISPSAIHSRVVAAKKARARRQRVRSVVRLAAAACVATVCLSAAFWYRQPAQDEHVFRTVVTTAGTPERVALPDGSIIELNQHSSVRVEQRPEIRAVTLVSGEALFQVAHDPGRPFFVDADRVRVRVVGTEFNVRQAHSRVFVSVRQGTVAVQDSALRDKPLATLTAGQGLSVGRATGDTHAQVVAGSAVAAWRSGQLRFRAVPLADVTEELAGYMPGKRVTVDADVSAVPVSGFASIRDPAAFIDALPSLVPVRVIRDSNGNISVISQKQGSLPAANPLSRK